MAIFEISFEKTMAFEGGYVLHEVPGDRGGMTFAGIARTHGRTGPGGNLLMAGNIRAQDRGYGCRILQVKFWGPIRGDQIRFQGVADMIYDFAVNAGIETSVKIAQGIVGACQDGDMGPKTIAKLSEYIRDEPTERLFMAEFSLAKVYRYKDICRADRRRKDDRVKSNLKFLCGWINRVQKSLEA